ncbi:hypothetical protein ACQ4WX_01010 [Streptomyces lasalocidi]
MIKRIATLAALLPAMLSTTAGVASAHPAPQATSAVVTLTYDASNAGQWAGAVQQAVQNWNDAVHNVRLEPREQPRLGRLRLRGDQRLAADHAGADLPRRQR